MIMQAIIEAINDDGTCYVNIPNFTNSGAKHLSTSGYLARFSVIPNSAPNVQVGDRVYVGFLNNNIGNPIIIGHMYFKEPDISAVSDSAYSARFADVEVTGSTTLSANTSIGDVSSIELSYLKGLSSNLQKQLKVIDERLTALESRTNT